MATSDHSVATAPSASRRAIRGLGVAALAVVGALAPAHAQTGAQCEVFFGQVGCDIDAASGISVDQVVVDTGPNAGNQASIATSYQRDTHPPQQQAPGQPHSQPQPVAAGQPQAHAQPGTLSQPVVPVQPIAPLEPATPQPDPLGDLAPVSAVPTSVAGRDGNFVWAGLGVGTAQFGQDYAYNGAGGPQAASEPEGEGAFVDTFGSGFDDGRLLLGASATLGASLDNLFIRANGFSGQGDYRWTDTSGSFDFIASPNTPTGGDYDVAASASLLRGMVTGGLRVMLDERLSAEVGPSVWYARSAVNHSIDFVTVQVDEERIVTSTGLGASAGISLAPDFSRNVTFWGHAALHGLYGTGEFSVDQTLRVGADSSTLSQEDLDGGAPEPESKLVYGAELAANVGLRLGDNMRLNGGLYANFLSDVAIMDGYDLASTSLLDFGASASLAIGF